MDAYQLLDRLWTGGGYGYYWTAPEKKSYWFPANEPGQIPNSKQNVYFGVNPVFAIPSTNAHGEQKDRHYIRSQNDYIGAVNAVFGEFDLKDFGSTEQVLSHIGTLPDPSVTIFSGGGYHLYWFFDRTFSIETEQDRARARELQANWTDFTRSDKQSKDLARVLRVPGTRNYKPQYAPNFPAVAIVDATPAAYHMPYLESLCQPARQPQPAPLPPPPRPATSDDKKWLGDHALRVAGDMIRQAVDGEKHCTLLKAARLLGGYVAGGILGESESIQWLEQEISHKPGVADLNGAFKTIRDGMEYGKAAPITLEQKMAERAARREEKAAAVVAAPVGDRRFWSRQFEGYWERVR